ncbi:MAG: hypothetical protein M3R69_04210 [Acidobacteriota bacterium]|nr:hypothetical protein [Acidobacteriota bacterium]
MDGETYNNVKEIEKGLGLPVNFLLSIYQEDDWSFVIKLHSMVEAAVTHLLHTRFGDERLTDVLSALQLGHRKTGKLAFVTALGLLSDENVRLITGLSELRNRLIHGIKNIQFDFGEYFNGLDDDRFNQFVASFGHAFKEESEIGGRMVKRKEIVRQEGAKTTIFLSAAYCLSDIRKLV